MTLRSALRLLRPLLILTVLGSCADPDARIEESATPVRIQVLARHDFQPTLSLLGTLTPSGVATVTAPVAGRLAYPARFADGLATGEAVAAGEVLAMLDSLPSRDRLAEARLGERAAVDELQRARRGVELGVLPHADLERAEIQADAARERVHNAEAAASRLLLRAPASGTLTVLRALPAGSDVAAGESLCDVALGGAPSVESAAAAADAALLHPGLAARVLSADGSRPLAEATLREVGGELVGGTLRVVLTLAAATARLPPPGSGVVVEVLLTPRSGVLTLPEDAVVTGAGGAAVWIVAPGADRQRVTQRTVELGGRGGGEVEIVNGLAPGDRVAVSGLGVLQPGAPIVEEAAPARGPASRATAPPAQNGANLRPGADLEPARGGAGRSSALRPRTSAAG